MASEKQRRKRKSKALSALDEASMEEYEPRSHHKRRKSESGFLSGLKNTKVNEMEEYNGRKRQVNPLDLKKAKVNADTKGTPFDLGGAIQKNKNDESEFSLNMMGDTMAKKKQQAQTKPQPKDDSLIDLPNAVDNVYKAFQKKPKYDAHTGQPLQTTPLYDTQTGKPITEENKPVDSLQGLVTTLGKGIRNYGKASKIAKERQEVTKLQEQVNMLKKKKELAEQKKALEKEKEELEAEINA